MDKLSNRYFIRYNTEKHTNVRMPLCSAKTLLRVFIQFIIADFHSLEIYREDYFDKKVLVLFSTEDRIFYKMFGNEWDNFIQHMEENIGT